MIESICKQIDISVYYHNYQKDCLYIFHNSDYENKDKIYTIEISDNFLRSLQPLYDLNDINHLKIDYIIYTKNNELLQQYLFLKYENNMSDYEHIKGIDINNIINSIKEYSNGEATEETVENIEKYNSKIQL